MQYRALLKPQRFGKSDQSGQEFSMLFSKVTALSFLLPCGKRARGQIGSEHWLAVCSL